MTFIHDYFTLKKFTISASEKFNTSGTSITINFYTALVGRCALPPALGSD